MASFTLGIVNAIAENDITTTVITIIVSILSIVADIMCIVCLKKAEYMLK